MAPFGLGGYNFSGELGDGTGINKNAPAQIGLEITWQILSAGGQHSLAIKQDGTLWAWGNNGYGQLGNNTNTNKNTPTNIVCWPTSIENQDVSNLKISICPNPVNDKLFISHLQTSVNYQILNLSGDNLQIGNLSPNEPISVTSLKKGIYILKINNETLKFYKL
jgi:alpha-tubulin suppressor-like RCC1 family protein